MTEYKQLILHDPNNLDKMGDCYRTTIGCILNRPPEEIPHFVQMSHDTGEYFGDLVDAWMKAQGYQRKVYSYRSEVHRNRLIPGEYVECSGLSPRFGNTGIWHSLVGLVQEDHTVEIVYDPHPDAIKPYTLGGPIEFVERYIKVENGNESTNAEDAHNL